MSRWDMWCGLVIGLLFWRGALLAFYLSKAAQPRFFDPTPNNWNPP